MPTIGQDQGTEQPTRVGRSRPPLVLVINDQEWSSRSFDSILGPNGFAVLRAYTGRKGLERARASRPDLIFIDLNLPDMDGLDLCRVLRDDPAITVSTPILITTGGHPTRAQRLAALRSGAWDFVSHPVDAEELLLRLDAYARAKLDADQARDESLLDPVTGLYNLRGFSRRAREVGSQAFRNAQALACVVVSPEVLLEGTGQDDASDEEIDEAVGMLAGILKQSGRVSDVIGRVGRSEFAVFAVNTDAEGAMTLAKRLATSINGAATPHHHRVRLRAGYDAVPDYREASLEPTDLLKRASSALHKVWRNGTTYGSGTDWISGFRVPQPPTN